MLTPGTQTRRQARRAAAAFNKALELPPGGSATRAFSCHAGGLRSREMNRASRLKPLMIAGSVQLNFPRSA